MKSKNNFLVVALLCTVYIVVTAFTLKPGKGSLKASTRPAAVKKQTPTLVPPNVTVTRYGVGTPVTDIYVTGTIAGVITTTHYTEGPSNSWNISNAGSYSGSWTMFVTVNLSTPGGNYGSMALEIGAPPFQCRPNSFTTGTHTIKFFSDPNGVGAPGQKLLLYSTGTCP